MSEWKEYKLGDIADVKGGKRLPKGELLVNYETPHPYIRITDLGEKWIRKAGLQFVPSEIQKNISRYIVNSGDVILSIVGSIGFVGRIPQELNGANLTENCVKFLTNKKIIDNDFLYYFLLSSIGQEEINKRNVGSTQPKLPLYNIKDVDISLPPLPEQTAIASILSSLDDKKDLFHRQNATLEKMAETLFRHWFVEEAKEEWDEINFGEFVTPKKGKNITKSEVVEGSYPVVAGGLEPSCYHIEANTKSPVITISASGANAGYIRLYTTPVWSSDSSYIDESITPYVYFCYVFLKINQSKLTDKQEGSAQPHIYPSHIMELDFMSYPESIIKVFEESARPLFNKIKSNQTQIRTLTALRDTLLPKLMSGEVRVEPD